MLKICVGSTLLKIWRIKFWEYQVSALKLEKYTAPFTSTLTLTLMRGPTSINPPSISQNPFFRVQPLKMNRSDNHLINIQSNRILSLLFLRSLRPASQFIALHDSTLKTEIHLMT